MEKKASVLVLLLMFVLIDELVVESEARACYARCKKFHGLCYRPARAKNCRTLCKSEKFIGGHCSRGACWCSKKCGTVAAHPPPPPPPPESGGDDQGEDPGNNEGGGEEAVLRY